MTYLRKSLLPILTLLSLSIPFEHLMAKETYVQPVAYPIQHARPRGGTVVHYPEDAMPSKVESDAENAGNYVYSVLLTASIGAAVAVILACVRDGALHRAGIR